MFPLSTVVFPFQRIPLHVFEPRYRQLVDDVNSGDGRFGICLIARGSEVGGHDDRVEVGTLVELRAVFPFSDGRSMLVVDGQSRIIVHEWLEDNPYPQAKVEILAGDDRPHDLGLLMTTEAAVRSVRNLHSEMHPDSCVDVDCALEIDPCVRAWQLCAVTPMATLDQLRLLRLNSADDRLHSLTEVCGERYGDLTRQLAVDEN